MDTPQREGNPLANPQTTAALVALETETASLLNRIGNLPPEVPGLRSPEGGWTIAQIVQHVAVTEETIILNRYVAAMRRGETGEDRTQAPARPADPRIMRNRSPKVQTFPELEPDPAVTWEEARSHLETVGARLREAALACPPGTRHLHPRFGMLSLATLIQDVAAGHLNRHRQQVEEILSQNGY